MPHSVLVLIILSGIAIIVGGIFTWNETDKEE